MFFPSYDYLRSAVQVFENRFPQIAITGAAHGKCLTRTDKKFLSAFEDDSEVCGFAVMGGAFSEGD